MTTTQSITLPDGRNLSYAEFGKRTGHPVFYFHGSPSSSLEILLLGNQVLIDNNLWIIAPNRPGITQSDPLDNRGFSDWPTDVLSLADHLKLKKFSVLGLSGGGGYVTVCAAKIPERLISAVVVSGAWQMNDPEVKKHSKIPFSMFWTIAAKMPFLLPHMLMMMSFFLKLPKKKALRKLSRILNSEDLKALLQGERMEVISKSIYEAINHNKKSAAWDVQLYVREWDFDLKEVNFPITYFHGQKDKNVPVELVKKMISLVPNATLIPLKNEAHFSPLCNHFQKIAEALSNKNQ